MYEHALVLLSIVFVVSCDVFDEDAVDKSRMVGVDAVHDLKIDKDTIITRNLKLEKRMRGKKPAHVKKEEEREPDWSYSAIPHEVSAHVLQFKRNMTECFKEVQETDKRAATRLSPRVHSPVHGECLIACVLKRNGVIHNGKLYKENLISLVSKFYSKDTKLMKKLEKNLDRCIELSVRIEDECELAAQLNECTNDLMASNKHKITVNY